VTILLTGDVEAPAQRELMQEYDLTADVLKVPHHGSKTSIPAFFAVVEPQVAVIQVGRNNRFGHPHEEVQQALGGITTFRTDLHGRISITTDGTWIRAHTER
jgi:competence protein ComEC